MGVSARRWSGRVPRAAVLQGVGGLAALWGGGALLLGGVAVEVAVAEVGERGFRGCRVAGGAGRRKRRWVFGLPGG